MSITKLTKYTIYNTNYRNLNIQLKFTSSDLFWKKYPSTLDSTLLAMLKDIVSLSAIVNTLSAELSPLGLYSVICVDQNTGSGLELITEEVADIPVATKKKK